MFEKIIGAKGVLLILLVCLMGMVLLSGCGDNAVGQNMNIVNMQESNQTVEMEKSQENGVPDSKSVSESDYVQRTEEETVIQDTSGEDLDAATPDTADDKWYMKGNIYTDDKGNRLEVFFDDESMLEFAVNGLSMYYTTVDDFQQENNWKVYTCDNGIMVIYYPGEPAHLEISGGDYAGLYEAGGDKIK